MGLFVPRVEVVPVETVRVELVPISLPDPRPYEEKWQDKRYLQQVIDNAGGTAWMTEVTEALREMRELADNATSTKELRGLSMGIKALKAVLMAGERARRVLGAWESYKNAEENAVV